VSVLDTSTNTVVTVLPVGATPFSMAVTARNLYVVNQGSHTVSVIDV
jgi:DNA-binding beta-propeller fold protein YncE